GTCSWERHAAASRPLPPSEGMGDPHRHHSFLPRLDLPSIRRVPPSPHAWDHLPLRRDRAVLPAADITRPDGASGSRRPAALVPPPRPQPPRRIRAAVRALPDRPVRHPAHAAPAAAHHPLRLTRCATIAQHPRAVPARSVLEGNVGSERYGPSV